MKKTKRNSRGFTLIEILVTTVIASIISLALFSAFASGLKVWRRVNTRLAEEQFVLFCERLAADLRTSFVFSGIAFVGDEKKLECASFVPMTGQPVRHIGKLLYDFDDTGVTRSTSDYAAVYAGSPGTQRVVLTGLEEFAFEYYFFDSGKKQFQWAAEWDQKELPIAVRVTCAFKDGRKATRTFQIPAGGAGI